MHMEPGGRRLGSQTLNNFTPTTVTLAGVANLQPAMSVALNANQLQGAGNTIQVTIHGYNTVDVTNGNAPIVYELDLCDTTGCVGATQNNVLQSYTQQTAFSNLGVSTFNLPWQITRRSLQSRPQPIRN